MSCRVIASLLILGCFASGIALAESVEMFSDEALRSVALSVLADQDPLFAAPESPAARSYRPFWVMAGWLMASTIYDAEATFYLLDRCQECREQNPFTRPILEQGRLVTYLYSAALNGVVMYIARRMYDRGDPWWRIGPLTLAIVHGIAGTWNLIQAIYDPHT